MVVVNYNGWRDTLECLESIIASDYPDVRVVVCDNASTDGSPARIREWIESHGTAPVRLVECGANLGFAGANNVGLRLAMEQGARHALLFNNDAVMAPGAIAKMVDAAERMPKCGAVGATILQYHDRERVETLAGATLRRSTGMVERVAGNSDRRAPRPVKVAIDYVIGCCMLVPMETVRDVGLMAEDYFLYGEDTDWCLRMTAAGYEHGYAPDAEVWHKGGGSVVHRSAVHDYYAVRGTLMLMHRHFRPRMPLVLGHAVLRFLLPKLARGQWRRFAAAARGYRDFLRHAAGRPIPMALR